MYSYKEQRSFVFTEEGQIIFLKIRDKIHNTLETAGAIRMDCAIAGNTGQVWDMMACVDRLVELNEIVEVTNENVPGQFRIFTK